MSIMTSDAGPQYAGDGRRMVPLSWTESIALLGSVSFGRIVFTARALPAIRPVNHLLDEGDIIIRTHLGSAITGEARGDAVVAYEADAIDSAEHLGWSVVVTGIAWRIRDQQAVARYKRLLRPWVDGPKESVIRVMPEMVTGYRLAPVVDQG
jgi:Pyridoxamine 5'-phosphate oxidase